MAALDSAQQQAGSPCTALQSDRRVPCLLEEDLGSTCCSDDDDDEEQQRPGNTAVDPALEVAVARGLAALLHFGAVDIPALR